MAAPRRRYARSAGAPILTVWAALDYPLGVDSRRKAPNHLAPRRADLRLRP
jgi:hypothetical protein